MKRGILRLGGLQLSDLRYSSFERGLIVGLFLLVNVSVVLEGILL